MAAEPQEGGKGVKYRLTDHGSATNTMRRVQFRNSLRLAHKHKDRKIEECQ